MTLFTWPALYNIWLVYLQEFIARYGERRIERTRDMFEKAISTAPEDRKRIFFLMYADFEETHGLINHAVEIYDRMVEELAYKEKLQAYDLYAAKVAGLLGVTKTRRIFEKAIEVLENAELIQIGLRFAKLERRCGEIDRARAIYSHIS